MSERKSSQLHLRAECLREELIFSPFEPSTDWTRDLGADDRVDVPDEEAEADT